MTRRDRKLVFRRKGDAVDKPVSLTQELASIGRLTVSDPTIVAKAYVFYVKLQMSAFATANKLGIQVEQIKEWAIAFDWDQLIEIQRERDYRTLANIGEKKGNTLDHTVAKGLKAAERIAVKWLEDHQKAVDDLESGIGDEEEKEAMRAKLLSTKDVQTIVTILDKANVRRREIAGIEKTSEKQQITVEHRIGPSVVSGVGDMIRSLTDQNPTLARAQIECETRQVEQILDAEYEINDESFSRWNTGRADTGS